MILNTPNKNDAAAAAAASIDSDMESHEDDCSRSHGTQGSTSGGTSRSTDEDIESIRDQLTKSETMAVFRLRVTVMIVLFLAATGVSVTVYLLTRGAELDELTIQYNGAAEKILESFNDIFQEMGSVSGLAVGETAHSIDHHLPFPFMRMTNFQEKAGNARGNSKTLFVSISTLVTKEQLPEWDEYVMGENNTWIDAGYTFQEIAKVNNFEDPHNIEKSWLTDRKVDPPHTFDKYGVPSPMSEVDNDGPYLLRWQTSPVLKSSQVNTNVFQEKGAAQPAKLCVETEAAVLSGFILSEPGSPSHELMQTSFFATLQSMEEGEEVNYLGDPMSFLMLPVFNTFDITNRKVVAVMKSVIHWRAYLRGILPSNVNGIIVVLENECDGSYTYEINGDEAYVVGSDDQHDTAFDYMAKSAVVTLETLDDGTAKGIELNQGQCPYSIHVYPSQEFYDNIVTSDPIIVTFAVGMVFFFTIILFLIYDRLVERRQRLILAKATQSTAIVSSLFPKQVRDRLMQAEHAKGGNTKANGLALGPNHRLKTFLNGNPNINEMSQQPIADLFPNCTVYFADISGFTAWSSTREPAQVFLLLQAVYQAFDQLAKRRRVFKVETIGDSYVAVTGLPEPQSNHAVIMVRFASECLKKLGAVTKELEVTLGPDTGDLGMRFGLHSGPVTAGVLRGDRARFQLFGDTVNTASRMESTGERNKIQVSQATADALSKAGKSHWMKPRVDGVKAKGKGVLKTFWVDPNGNLENGSDTESGSNSDKVPLEDLASMNSPTAADARTKRLVDWMAELLSVNIKKVVARRRLHVKVSSSSAKKKEENLEYTRPTGSTCLDEVKEALNMPKFDERTAAAVGNAGDEVPMEPRIVNSLKEYVTIIAATYRFEHACHVTMSVSKLLKRIVAPELSAEQLELANRNGGQGLASHLHDFSHGIVSDPLAVFAITFSALIHDADHRGVSNMQLAKEEPSMASGYRNKSIAEQNSLDIAWDVLMLEQFKELRQFIFGTQEELMRFRHLIVNIVLATDIFDKELNDLRKNRWTRAFSAVQPGQDVNDLRATIVMEHIIQASDVSHTMQHWHVYQKWNRQLFKEMYLAYKAGRMGADPSTFWYQGELGFFDNYIIPLAKKLKECNVFGVSSDEYLNYAVLNRAEWEERGMEIVKDLLTELGD